MLPMRYSVLGVDLTKIRVLIFLVGVLALAGNARCADREKRKIFAQQLTKDIVQPGLRKIYVPDFTDSSGRQVALGWYFAATFSALLDDNAKGFAVVSRVDVHRYLGKSGRTDHDLSTPDVLAKLVSDFGLDAILCGSLSVNQEVATINLTMRDPLGKELFQSRYEEKLDPDLRAVFEVSPSGAAVYFAELDGVSVPKCLYCPSPSYPVGQGSRSLEGDVVLSVLVTVDGKPDQIRLVQTLDPAFDRAALEDVQSWRFEPGKDSEGNSVPVRVPIQVTFKMHWQIH
jgi:TonB family protein